MKRLVRQMNNKLIKLLYNLDRQEGFMGMMLAMIMSVAIFTILSSVHIYTVNHAQYQSGIKEAYIMQTDVENFASLISDAYNKGRDGTCSTSDCCTVDSVSFKLGENNCSDLKKVCLKSSGGRGYCLVKLEAANFSQSPPPPTHPSSLPDEDKLRDCLKVEGNGDGVCYPGTINPVDQGNCNGSPNYAGKSLENLCQIVAKGNHSYSSTVDVAINKCCEVAKLPVINCEHMPSPPSPPSTCDNYENNLAGAQRMWCEICEKHSPSSPDKRLFTYYICPAIVIGTPPTETYQATACTDKIKTTSSAEDKAQSGVFYQTFRVLAH